MSNVFPAMVRSASLFVITMAALIFIENSVTAQEALTAAQQTALADVQQHASDIRAVNRAIWEFAEVGLAEQKSSALLMERLKAAGFTVQAGLADMPTAFVASYGSGQPVIAILAEYDALPGLSQKVSPDLDPLTTGAPGHGCGHSGLGAGAFGAALAVKSAMMQHRLPGTIRLYGTPAEETTIGKVYMTLAGVFKDVDVCLHWHPSTKNELWNGSSKAIISAKFTFNGVTAHAAGSPENGRSALDAVELMNIGVNFMREHVKEDARLHYVITEGGGAPNVVPATATVWYYVRADDHKDVEKYFARVQDIAKGAALMTRTKMKMDIDTDCHEIVGNTPLAELVHRQFTRIEAPKFTPEEHAFARRLQEPLLEQNGKPFAVALDEKVYPMLAIGEKSKGSTDVGDISWHIPTMGLRTACFPFGSPGHCWQNVASIGSTVGEKGSVYAAQLLSSAAVELLQRPDIVAAAKTDFANRMKEKAYTSLIPAGQKPPTKIR
ncbi:MAG: amidohydrolase [Planctomycetaceae bacterium]|nr:amidohydrolase [Planctomycetaceae bacterium]